jgi:hypothetical protein
MAGDAERGRKSISAGRVYGKRRFIPCIAMRVSYAPADPGQVNSFGRWRRKPYAARLFESLHCRGGMTTSSKPIGSWRTPSLVIGCGCLIAIVAFGPRSTLGFFLTPMSSAHHWGRDVFAFALALQNLLWGARCFTLSVWR